MKAYFQCLSAEILKTRRTIYLLGSILLPVLLAAFNFLLHLGVPARPVTDQRSAWMSLFHNTYSLGALLVFPTIFVFASTFAAHQEHDIHHWRCLASVAVPRSAVYLAKVTLTMGLGLVSCLVMLGADMVLGVLYAIIRPDAGLAIAQMPVLNMLAGFLLVFGLGLLMAVFQLFFSIRVNNFVMSIGVGLALILAGMFFTKLPWMRFIYPWSLPALVYTADSLPEILLPLVYSILGFGVVTALSCRAFIHQDIQD